MGSRLNISSSSMTVGQLKHSPGEYFLDAPYQRGTVWAEEQQRNLIRSLLWGIPTGMVTLSVQSVYSDVNYRVVDGKQRISTLIAWFADELACPREWFIDNGDLESDDEEMVTYSQLTDTEQRIFDRTTFAYGEFNAATEWLGRDENGENIVRKRTEEEVLAFEAKVYLLINRGGVPHRDEDLDDANDIISQGA